MPSDRADRLAAHARARHQQTLQRAETTLADMVKDGEPVTISRLASKAAVSRAWIYTQPDLRAQIEQLQQHPQRQSVSRDSTSVNRATTESLRRRLTLALETLTQLRAENQQLRQDLARVHGQLRQAKTQSAPPPEAIQAPF
ncbi:DUF6262 family protein [Nonomuraea sp. M3C6]|uniref:DUF6262 family protein n=1 Tax=Nonomuraea marmarensis TaxID=3351344 RepID=A0ABW7AXQ8_9ACTN